MKKRYRCKSMLFSPNMKCPAKEPCIVEVNTENHRPRACILAPLWEEWEEIV